MPRQSGTGLRKLGDYPGQGRMSTRWPWGRDGEQMREREREEEGVKCRTADAVLLTMCVCPSLKNIVGDIEYGLYIR